MTIQRATEYYYADILQLIRNFHQEALKEYNKEIDEKYLLEGFDKFKKDAFLLIIDGKCEGLLAGSAVTTPLNPNKIYQEVIWYINPQYRKYGVQLLKDVQQQLKAEGFTMMTMVCMENSLKDKLFKFYQTLGFRPFEHHFIKEL